MLILFGSQAKNNTHQESDVDLLFVREKALKSNEETEIYNELYQVFKNKIDLINLKNASPLLLGEIAKNGKLLYGKTAEFKKLKINALLQYLDFEPYFKLQEKILKKHLNKIHA